LPEIVDLFTEAFEGSVPPLGSYSREKHRQNVSSYFDRHGDVDVLNRASSLLYGRSSDDLAGACLVQAGAVLPSINWLAVAKKYRRRGLASAMIKKALTVLHEQYRWLKINVHAGNPAAALYHSLGFRSGLVQTSVYMPARTDAQK
jgi:ribosomal protein S18 acetylase RimI-like enzyme